MLGNSVNLYLTGRYFRCSSLGNQDSMMEYDVRENRDKIALVSAGLSQSPEDM